MRAVLKRPQDLHRRLGLPAVVSVDEISAEELRDLHVTGDVDLPSICAGTQERAAVAS